MSTKNWGIIDYTLFDFNDVRKDKLLNGFKEIYSNGDCFITCFIATETELFDRAITTWSSEGNNFRLHSFLSSPSIAQNLENLNIPDMLDLPKFNVQSSYEFEGGLIDMLLTGGCYEKWQHGEQKAREIAKDFVDMVAENYRASLLTFKVLGNWTDWFMDLGYDSTFISCNLTTRKLWFICATDYD